MVAGQAMAPGLAVVRNAGVALWPNPEVATILLLDMVVVDARGLQLTQRPAILSIVGGLSKTRIEILSDYFLN